MDLGIAGRRAQYLSRPFAAWPMGGGPGQVIG